MTRETCNDHILLVGFMGSGKTSVSRRLSAITGLSLIDVDYRIEAIQHRKIPS
ncbi:MAG: shikimate kinase, partial [Bacteroidales bacterium]